MGDYGRWLKTNVRPQKQAGYVIVGATVPLGDLTSEQMRVIADLSGAYSDGMVRVSADQDLFFRWVNNRDVADLYRRLCGCRPRVCPVLTDRRRDELPWAPNRASWLATGQSRGLGRMLGDFSARPV